MASVKADRVLDNWMTVVENGAGNGDEIYGAMDEALEEIKLPYVKWSIGQVNTGLMTQSREFMIVTHGALREYTIDIIRNREPIIGVKSEAYYENRFL